MNPAGTAEPSRAAARGPGRTRHDSKIFISYRRSDAKHPASRLYEHLCTHFGEHSVFMDRRTIEGGDDFVEVIKRELSASGAMVVVVGEHWLDASEDGKRRLEQPNDYVRGEVAAGLEGGAFVLPVLLDGAQMPREEELPDDLKPFARRNAMPLDDLHWHEDVEKLTSKLDAELKSRAKGVWATLRRLWARPLVRAAAGLLALAAAFVLQYRLAYRPLPVDLRETGLFSPAALAPGRDELVIEGPVTNSADGLLFSHVGRPYELVDVSCEGARLDDSTLRVFRHFGGSPPTAPAALGLMTVAPRESEGKEAQPPQGKEERPPQGETCRTSVEVGVGPKAPMPVALHLYRLGGEGGERFRGLELKADGADLLLNAVTAMPEEGTPDSLGCRRRLTVGGAFERITSGTFTVGAVVAAGGAIRFSFNDAGPGAPRWGDAADLFQPFALGGEKLAPGDPEPLRASAVSITRLGGPEAPGAPPSLSARAADGEMLSIDSLKLGAEQLAVGVSGRGLVRVGGADYVNLSGRLRANPVPALLFAVLDLALVVWFLLQLFGARRRS